MTLHLLHRHRHQLEVTCSTCAASGLTQACGTCGRRLCPTCYGEWHALACAHCRAWAAMVLDDVA